MTTPDRSKWRALLEAELARRTARVEWQAGKDERQREQLIDTLQQMAQRLGVSAHRVPLDVSDMSIAEMFAVRWFLPEDLWPMDLPTEDQIWREYAARKQGRLSASREKSAPFLRCSRGRCVA